MADNRALATRTNPSYGNQGSLDPEKAKEEFQSLTNREFYYARGGGGRAPSARLVKIWATSEKINCEVVEYGADKDKAWAKVRAWKGEKSRPDIEREDAVVLTYQDMLVAAIFEAVENGVSISDGQDQDGKKKTKKIWPKATMGPDGMPIISEPAAQFSIMKTYAEKRKFGARAAISAAKRRVFLEVLGAPEEDDTPDDHDIPPTSGGKQTSPSVSAPMAENSTHTNSQTESQAIDPQLKKTQAFIGRTLLARCDDNKEEASERLGVITEKMKEAGKITQAYKFPSKIMSPADALYISEVLEAQEQIMGEFMAVAGGDIEIAKRDFGDLMRMHEDDPKWPKVDSPTEICDLDTLSMIIENSSVKVERFE